MSWEIEYTDNFENWWQTLSEKYIPIADELYDEYLQEIREEGLI